MWVDFVREHDALSEPLKTVYERSRKSTGVVSEIVKSTSLRPEATLAWTNLSHSCTFGKSLLGRRREELVALRVSVLNNCTYCTVAHGEFLRKVTQDPELVLQVAEDWRSARLSEPERYMLEFVEILTIRPHALSEQRIRELRDVGFTDEEIVDVILGTAYRNFITRVAEATGVKVDENLRQKSKNPEMLDELADLIRSQKEEEECFRGPQGC